MEDLHRQLEDARLRRDGIEARVLHLRTQYFRRLRALEDAREEVKELESKISLREMFPAKEAA